MSKVVKSTDGTIGNSFIMLVGYFCGKKWSRNDISRSYHRFIEVIQIKYSKVSLVEDL